MKIGILTWRDSTHPQAGGAEQYISEQAKLWVNQGHEVVFFCGAYSGAIEEEHVDGIDYIRKGGRFSVYWHAMIAYFRYMKDCDILIDINNGIPFFTPFYSRKKKILVVYHISGDMWYKEMPKTLAAIGKFLETKVMPLAYRNAKVVTISPSSKKQCKDIGLHSSDIVYPGINPWYHPGIKAEQPEILYIGRLKKYKSVDTLLKSVAKVDTHLKVNIIGTGDDGCRLKQMADDLHLDNVDFLGFVNEAEKTKLLQRAWFVVNPSMIEGWGIVAIEANACGTPVIASDVPGSRDSVLNKDTGMLFQYNNVEDLASKIKILLTYKSARDLLSENALVWARNFSWKKSADKFLEIIKREVERK